MRCFLLILLSSFLFCCNNKQNSEGKLLKEPPRWRELAARAYHPKSLQLYYKFTL